MYSAGHCLASQYGLNSMFAQKRDLSNFHGARVPHIRDRNGISPGSILSLRRSMPAASSRPPPCRSLPRIAPSPRDEISRPGAMPDENFKRARPPVQSDTVNKRGHLEQAKRKSQIRRRREAALVVPVRRLPPGRSCGRSRRASAPAAFQPLSCQAAPARAPQWHRHRVSGRRCGFS